MKCHKCECAYSIKELVRTKGRCPLCGATIPVSDYCTHIPERRWWHLYSAAPASLKIAATFLGMVGVVLLVGVAMDALGNLFGGRGKMGVLEDAYGGACCALFLMPLIRTIVRGKIPFISMLMFGVIEFTLTSCAQDRIEFGLIAFVPVSLTLLPAARHWRTYCRENELAYSIAVKIGAAVSAIPFRELPLKRNAVLAFSFIVFGLMAILTVLVVCGFPRT